MKEIIEIILGFYSFNLKRFLNLLFLGFFIVVVYGVVAFFLSIIIGG